MTRGLNVVRVQNAVVTVVDHTPYEGKHRCLRDREVDESVEMVKSEDVNEALIGEERVERVERVQNSLGGKGEKKWERGVETTMKGRRQPRGEGPQDAESSGFGKNVCSCKSLRKRGVPLPLQ